MSTNPTLQDVLAVIRDQVGTPKIYADTLLEARAGVTGDDGVELLERLERAFDLTFEAGGGLRELFGMSEYAFLFGPEGSGLIHFVGLWRRLFGKPAYSSRDVTPRELHEAILVCRAAATSPHAR